MIVHIAGPAIQIGALLRQRCSWCGVTLLDYDLDRIAMAVMPLGDDHPNTGPSTWPQGELVAKDGNASYVVAHEDGAQLPEDACGKVPAELTA